MKKTNYDSNLSDIGWELLEPVLFPTGYRKRFGRPVVYDAGKKNKGCKRHLMTNIMGLILAVNVLGAYIQDRNGVKVL